MVFSDQAAGGFRRRFPRQAGGLDETATPPGLHSAGRGGQLQEQAVWPGLFQIFLRKNRRGNRIENHPVWRQIPPLAGHHGVHACSLNHAQIPAPAGGYGDLSAQRLKLATEQLPNAAPAGDQHRSPGQCHGQLLHGQKERALSCDRGVGGGEKLIFEVVQNGCAGMLQPVSPGFQLSTQKGDAGAQCGFQFCEGAAARDGTAGSQGGER